ncbi:uncharacterized protein LOC129588294 [Paramacrobiotus metropolitanus]|uniref:uncharacterized protein LOC129588294 n=1 Tax=Paramacrobiotus metropolitanus TaxID=2943436 RepID=UPI002445D6C5|nr:uncharacterized protein LOC129588294 [Paramacrobiotus metropolitanus]
MRKGSDVLRLRKGPPYPGRLFLRLFVSPSSVRDEESLLSKTSHFSTRCTGYAITAVFTWVFILDFVDLVHLQGRDKDPAYGRINPIIVIIGFAASQTTFFRAAASCIFSMRHGKEMVACAHFVLKCADVFKIPANRRIHHIKRGQLLFLFVEVSCIIRLVVGMLENLDNLYKRVPYGFFYIYVWQINAYIYIWVILASWINLPLLTMFYYLCAILNDCAEVCAEDIQKLLDEPAPAALSTDEFANKLKHIRRQHEMLCDMFERMQKTFSSKLLIDIAGNLFEVLVVIAWFCSWVALPTFGNKYKTARMLMTLLGTILRLIYLVAQPLKFSYMPDKLAELVDEALYQRQAKRKKYIASVTEVDVTQTLDRKVKSSDLTFCAGQIIGIDRATVISTIVSVAGFVCFIIERIESYSVIHSQDDNDLINC